MHPGKTYFDNPSFDGYSLFLMDTTGQEPSGGEERPILGSAAAGLRFELVPASVENLETTEQPFLLLNDTGRFSQTLLARVTIGADTTLRYYAVKIQRSTYRSYSSGTAQEFPTNTEIDEMWQREIQNLSASTNDHLTQVLDLGQNAFRSRPVLFCKKAKHYFHPFCPNCLGYLSTCQDENLLRNWSLPSYEKSAERFLYCAPCANETSAVLYTLIRNPELHPKDGVDVRARADLVRDICSAQDQQGRLKNLLPCVGTGCAAEGESQITPVSLHDFYMIPLELEQLHYDEWVDLVGGASWDSIRNSITERSPARTTPLSGVGETLSRPFQWMYQNSKSGLFAIEVMQLKISSFLQACQGLREYHAKTGSPHLSLDPANVMVTIPPGGPDLPARWNARTRIVDLGSAHRFRPMGGLREFFGDVFIPSPDIDKTYAAPVAKGGARSQEEAMRITIRNVTSTENGAWVEIDAISNNARLEQFRVRDLVHVVPTTPISWFEGVDLWGAIVEPIERGFRLSVFAPRLTGEPSPPITVDGSVTFLRRLDLPCDIYSLGMLFFRTLLVNDQQDILKVEDGLNRVLAKLMATLQGNSDPGTSIAHDRLLWELDAESELFQANNLLYSEKDRSLAENLVPGKIWQDALVLGFRLLSNIPDFSFCAHHGDRNMENPAALLDEIVGAVEMLKTRLQVELFSQEERNGEIAALCDEMQEMITGMELGS